MRDLNDRQQPGMLVMSRHEGEDLLIGDDIIVTVERIGMDRVWLLFTGTKSLSAEPGDPPERHPRLKRRTWKEWYERLLRKQPPIPPPPVGVMFHRNGRCRIDENYVVKVVEIRGSKVRLGIQAPKDIPVHRREVYEALRRNEELPRPE